MASLYIDIDEVELTEKQAKVLFEKLKAIVIAEHQDAEVSINEDSDYDEDPDDE